MQINSINQQTNFGMNTICAKKAMALDPKTKQIVASYTNFAAPLNKYKVVLKELPQLENQGENLMYLMPKDFGDIICITCNDGKASRKKVAEYLHDGDKKGLNRIEIE